MYVLTFIICFDNINNFKKKSMIRYLYSRAFEEQQVRLNSLKGSYVPGTENMITDVFLWPVEYRGAEFAGCYEMVTEKGVVGAMLAHPQILIDFESGRMKELTFKPMCRLLCPNADVRFAFYY